MRSHKDRMITKKEIVDKRIAKATEERGVLVLLKGAGKGKSSSALGTMIRSLGYGKKCAVIQFIKGRRETGECMFLRDHPLVDWHVMGQGFTWETQDKEKDIEAANQAWELAKSYLNKTEYDFLVFDEMSYMFKYRYLPIEPVILALKNRPTMQTVFITGRVMPPELEEIADTISNIKDEKHAFRQGVKAQKGIEF